MGFVHSRRTTNCAMFILLIVGCLLLILLSACSTDTSGSSASTPTTTTNQPDASASATAAENMLIQEMTFVGQPSAKLVSGTTFEVDGKLKNGDSKQHDIYIQAFLIDASGKQIASTQQQNVDNVPGGATVAYSIQGTTPQPTWDSILVKIVKVTENVNGAGPD